MAEKYSLSSSTVKKVVVEGNYTPNVLPLIWSRHWYWMPDVIETYFARFGKKPSDYFQLKRLSPSYRVFWKEEDYWDIPVGEDDCASFFE